MLDLKHENFVVHVISLSSIMSFSFISLDADVHLSHKPQIASLTAKKAFTKVLTKYANFGDIFFLYLAFKLFKHT